MKYLVFNTEQEAIEAEAQIALSLGCTIIGVNAKTELPEPNKCKTTRWAIPIQLLDARWAFPSPDDTGEELTHKDFNSEEIL